MRRILVEQARRKNASKYGGDRRRVELQEAPLADEGASSEDRLLALDEALERLSQKDPIKADLVKLRYFAGLTKHQAANALGISPSTCDRHWKFARTWLRLEIRSSESS